ncbi:MAG: hypothetical protein WAT39_01270 [Planctomycetota bacterium]
MRMRARFRPTVVLLAAVAACGSRVAGDPNSREIPWTYGPTTGGATAQHVQGTGKQGGAPVARGWQCRLHDGKRLVVRPFQLAESHPLFGKVAMSFGLFDKTGKELGMVRSGAVTAQGATFTFELAADVASRLVDLVVWYCEI